MAAPPWRAASARWLLGACGLALLAGGTQPTAANSDLPGAPPPAAALAVPQEAEVRTGFTGWGVISEIRRAEAEDHTPASHVFTVRMRDGSVRTSSGADAGRWKVGDRILLIG